MAGSAIRGELMRFSYTTADLLEAGVRLRSKSLYCRATRVALACAGPIALVAWTVGCCPLSVAVPLGIASSLLVVVHLWPNFRRLTERAVTFVLLFDRTAKLPRDGTVEVSLQPAGIQWKSTALRKFTPWNRVRRVVDDGEYVFLQISFNTYHWIPKRVFASTDDCVQFVAACCERAGEKVQKRV